MAAFVTRLLRSRKLYWSLGLLWLGSLGTASPLRAEEKAPSSAFVNRIYQDERGAHKYAVFIPKDYTPDRVWPVIVYLHGASARGRDGRLPLVAGLGPNVDKRRDSFPFIVVFPQCEELDCRLLGGWTDERDDADRALAILKDVESHYRVDPTRRSLVGVSMGAFGVWSVAARTPDLWSAIIPVSGGGPHSVTQSLTKLPVWAFHAADDQVVPTNSSSDLVDGVNAAGGRAYYTELPNGGHNIGSRVFANNELYTWLLNPSAEPVSPREWPLNANTELNLQHEVPFVAGGEMDKAVHVHLGTDVLAALAVGLPGQIPADAVQGMRGPQSQLTGSGWASFQVTASGVQYAGRVHQADVKPLANEQLQIRIGLQPLTMTILSTEIQGRLLRAQAGAMQVVIGAKRPAWLNIVIRPKVVDRQLKLELVSAGFPIESDNWYVTEPNGVDVFPLPMLRNRISQRLTEGVYAKQGDFERQVVDGVPAMLRQIEQQTAARMERVVTFGRWPMPVWQPRAKFWMSDVAVDSQGLSVSLGVTLGAVAPQTTQADLRTFPAPSTSPEPPTSGVQLSIARDVVKSWTTLLAASEVRRFHVQDFHAESFRLLAQRAFLADILPGGIDPDGTGDLRSVLAFEQPMSIESTSTMGQAPVPNAPGAERLSSSTMRLAGKELRLTISERATHESEWQPIAEFPLAWHQDFDVTTWKVNHRGRRLGVEALAPPDVGASGRWLLDSPPENPVRADLVAEQFRQGWEATFATALEKQMLLPERVVAGTPLVCNGFLNTGEYLVLKMEIPTTQIHNRSNTDLVYEIRTPQSGWSEPIRLSTFKMHEFKSTAPYTWRWRGEDREYLYTLPIGSVSRFHGGEERPLTLQTDQRSAEIAGGAEMKNR